METFIHADIFFFLTSVAVVVITIMFVIVGYYLIQTFRNIRDISEELKNIASMTTSDFERMRAQIAKTWLGKIIFGTPKKTQKGAKESV